jgi:hypothetical protein
VTEKVDVQAVIKAELKVMRMQLSGQLDAAVQRLQAASGTADAGAVAGSAPKPVAT